MDRYVWDFLWAFVIVPAIFCLALCIPAYLADLRSLKPRVKNPEKESGPKQNRA